jgi:hypothetical protein
LHRGPGIWFQPLLPGQALGVADMAVAYVVAGQGEPDALLMFLDMIEALVLPEQILDSGVDALLCPG